ncbi:alpha/beta fold hydrolase [Promicromonospora xylanilytica]
MRHVVLLPGFWHGTWCWGPVTLELARQQIPAVALDLQAQGLQGTSPSARWRRPFDTAAFTTEESKASAVTATSAAQQLVAQLRTIHHGEPSVVVAHSMGGVVATLAAEMEPSLFSHLVYVAALAPVSGQPAAVDVASATNAGELGTGLLQADPFMIGASRIDTGDTTSRELVRAALYADVPLEAADAATSMLGADAPVGIATEPISVTRERFGVVPHTYLLCTEDRMLKPALQRKIIKDIDCTSTRATRVVELQTSHSPFLSQPRQVAEVIHAAWHASSEPTPSSSRAALS